MRLLAFACSILLFAGAARAQQAGAQSVAPKPGAIGGRVMLTAGVPATACRVAVESASLTASCNTSGAFMLKQVPPGQYDVRITVPGAGEARLSAGTGEDQTTYLGDVTVGVPGAVSGQITADNSSDVDLSVIGIPELGLYTQANVTGGYLLPRVPGGTWNVTVLPPAQNPIVLPVTVIPGQPVPKVDFKIQAPPPAVAPLKR